MANKRVDHLAGMKIRHYVFGLLRSGGEASVALPSSYELAEMFETTRRVARYELERLIAEGVLISKPRIGTFTNPRRNYVSATPSQKRMPLIGVIHCNGEWFCYGCAENRIFSHLGLALAERKCYVHHAGFSCNDDESRLRELKVLGLDGIIWNRPDHLGFPSAEFLNQLEAEGIPVVSIGLAEQVFRHAIRFSTTAAEEELIRVFRAEGRRTMLLLSNTHLEVPFAARLLAGLGQPPESLRMFDTELFRDRIELARRRLAEGEVPDIIICDPMAAETIPELLAEAGIAPDRCRLVACNELNGEDDFRGYIVAPDPAEIAREAVELLFDLRSGKDGSREVPCRLHKVEG